MSYHSSWQVAHAGTNTKSACNMMGIYEITNLADGKMTSYVGSTVNIRSRWRHHILRLRRGAHPNPHLQHAWNKYGEGAFSFCLLEQVINKECLREREQLYLNRAFQIGDTYNIAQNVEAPLLGHNFTEEHKYKLSQALQGNNNGVGYRHTKESRLRMSQSRMGRHHSKEARRRMSESKKGKSRQPFTKEHRLNMSRALAGRTLPEEHGQKIGRANARPYPAFVHRETGEIIPAGINLSKLCRECELTLAPMQRVMHGRANHHQGWILADNAEE